MNTSTIKCTCFYLLSLFIFIHAESVYTVDKVLIPEYQIIINNKVYTKTMSESQVYDTQWKNKQKFSFSYDNNGNQNGYSVVYWSNTSNIWTDSVYCMFFYNTSEQPIAYYASSVKGDTNSSALYKEYYSYNSSLNKLDKIRSYSKNSADTFVLSSEEEYLYLPNSKLDSITTINHDEEYDYVWSTITQKYHYVNDTMYSIVENTAYKKAPDSAVKTYDLEYQYLYSNDGKKILLGKCQLPGIVTEKTWYSYRTEDGLPELELNQNIESLANKTFKDTSRITCSYSFQDQMLIKTATTEKVVSDKWVPVSRKTETYYTQSVYVQKNSLVNAENHYKMNVFLTRPPYSSFFISTSEKVTSIEFFSINGVLLYKENPIRCGNDIRLDLSHKKVADYCGPLIAKINLENGKKSIQRVLQIRR